MVKRCADCGFDLAGDRVEVVPTAHFMMGGVVFEPDGGTAIPGLYVAGEDAGGVHGANRLGGNGVADSTVFGGIAGDTMAAFVGAPTAPGTNPTTKQIDRASRTRRTTVSRIGWRPVRASATGLSHTMWEHAGHRARWSRGCGGRWHDLEDPGRRAAGRRYCAHGDAGATT